MNTPHFWKYFEADAYPRLGVRKDSLRYVFEHLDRKKRPVFLVETGCVREEGNWAGDGQSSLLFDAFVSQWPGSAMYSVDIDPKATELCRILVGKVPQIVTEDSVSFLRKLARNPPRDFRHLDVLYLDSYDVDFRNVHSSALHHMKELVAASSLIGPDTLVVVDDAPFEGIFVQSGSNINFLSQEISGKGKYVAEYAKTIGLKPVFSGYQAGWLGF